MNYDKNTTYWNTDELQTDEAHTMHDGNRRGDVVREVVLVYPGTFIEQMKKIFRNQSTWP